jgi:hypothetical protein
MNAFKKTDDKLGYFSKIQAGGSPMITSPNPAAANVNVNSPAATVTIVSDSALLFVTSILYQP